MPFSNSVNETNFYKRENTHIEQYVAHFAELWRSSTSSMPALERIHTDDDKLSSEYEIKRLYNIFKKKKRKFSYYSDEKAVKDDILFKSVKKFLMNRLGFTKHQINILISKGFYQITNEFIEEARKFNPKIAPSDLFQAIRNVWAMNWLQMLLGLKVELTPSVFAYSMLYPYTDNYLDNPGISIEDKIGFNNRLSEKLKGRTVTTASQREQDIHNLIGMIESQFNRADYPGVYDSLLAIHAAQEKSLLLSKPDSALSPEEILQISIEKGGASVLADGFLVSGDLTDEQMLFLFGYGAYLQLVDDLQDMEEDLKAGCSTVFLQAEDSTALNILVNQTFNFGNKVMTFYCLPEEQNPGPALSLMQMSSNLLFIEAIGQSNGYFSSSFVSGVERYSPVHFSFFRKYQKNFQHLALTFLE